MEHFLAIENNRIGLERLSCCCIEWKKDKSVYMIGSCFCGERLQNWSLHTLLLGKKKKLKQLCGRRFISSSNNQTILLLGKYPRELKKFICVQKLTNECSEQPYSSHPEWKQSECHSIDNWLKRGSSIQWNIIHPQGGMKY